MFLFPDDFRERRKQSSQYNKVDYTQFHHDHLFKFLLTVFNPVNYNIYLPPPRVLS